MDTLDAARVLPKMTLERLQALFDRLSDQKGRLDARGLKAVLDMVGVNFTDSDVADLVIEMDPRNKSLDFTDFVSVIMRPLDDDVLDDLRDVFDVLDRNKRGFVDAEDLRAAMESIINTPVSLLTAKEMLAEFCDAGEEGGSRETKLQLDEFMRVMVSK
ncbi:hypothetical protein KFE25_000102 [Diacronema lutheri]|uniref:EF-hand domain-containing protein n=2 Tax=Diacronema lutheri TaxID=2081491 RepID=A0A8J5XG56_DIALT|nr:hypothetical protein KFE25_000102 [Diacronema lutheri]